MSPAAAADVPGVTSEVTAAATDRRSAMAFADSWSDDVFVYSIYDLAIGALPEPTSLLYSVALTYY